MNYKNISMWLDERSIILEQSFVASLRDYAKLLKKTNKAIRCLEDVYAALDCSKQDISNWENKPCSTQAITRGLKYNVIKNASALFKLSESETESLANKAGLSLVKRENGLLELLNKYKGKYRDLLEKSVVSERMLQYYIAGKEPTKQALTSLAISLELSLHEIELLLRKHGYCLSKSLPNDMVVLWFLKNTNKYKNNCCLIQNINNTLYELNLPQLMTKLINR